MLGQARALFQLHPDLDRAYLERGIRERRAATMASKTSRANDKAERVIDMAAFAPELARRRAAAGEPVLPRNSGKRRTASKLALLEAIGEAGGKW
jgi:hypothetical protein